MPATRPARNDRLAGHPDNNGGSNPGRPGRCCKRTGAGPRLPRSRRPPRHHPRTGRRGTGPTGPNTPGAGKLRPVLHGDVPATLSKLEARFLERLRKAGLPLPQTNRPAGGRRVDCRWPELRLTVEVDGYRYHYSRYAWEQDRRREREARARGDEFRRYTCGDVFESPELMLTELRGLACQA